MNLYKRQYQIERYDMHARGHVANEILIPWIDEEQATHHLLNLEGVKFHNGVPCTVCEAADGHTYYRPDIIYKERYVLVKED